MALEIAPRENHVFCGPTCSKLEPHALWWRKVANVTVVLD